MRWMGALLAVLVLGSAGAYALWPDPAIKGTDTTPGFVNTPPVLPTFPPQRPISVAAAKLADRSKPVTIAVLTDSTGASSRGWIPDLAQWIGTTYHRSVYEWPWAQYKPPKTPHYLNRWTLYASDSGTPGVTIWDAAASGQNANYSREHLAEMTPPRAGPVDLVIISHGHNVINGQLIQQVSDLVDAVQKRFSDATYLVTLQNPEPAASANSRYLANNISRLKDWTETHHYPTVDVFAAFMAHPGWQKTLMDPKSVIHPSPAGYRVWASAVEKVLAG